MSPTHAQHRPAEPPGDVHPAAPAAVDEAPDPGAQVLDRIVAIEAERARLEAEQLRLMDELTVLRRVEAQGCAGGRQAGEVAASFATDEVAAALAWTVHRVQHRLANARRCRRDLPQLWRVWRAGQVDGFRADIVVEAARRLVHHEHVGELDTASAPLVAAKTATELRRWCEQFIVRVEPAELAERHEQAVAERRVRTQHDDADGMGDMWLFARGVDTAAIAARLAAQARALGTDDPRTMDQRRADLAVDLLLGRAAARCTAVSDPGGPASADVVVVVPLAALFGAVDAAGRLLDGTPVPAGVITELCDRPGTLFHRLLTDPRGDILDVTQLGRFPDPELRLSVQVRDGGCMFPGCTAAAERCDQDHTIAHPAGPTCWCNLGCLCRRHHRLKQHRRVRLRQPAPGVLEWTLPSGRRYVVRGDPVLDAPTPITRSDSGLLDLDPVIDEADLRDLLHPGADPTILTRHELDLILAA